MTYSKVEFSPQVYARMGGLAYLFIIVAGGCGELFIRNNIIVSGNAAATAHNIMASQLLWRISIAADLVMHLCDIVLMLVLYVLLKPVNKNLALMAMMFNLIQTAVLVANKMSLLMPLFFLSNADYLKPVDPQQLQAFSYLFVSTHGLGFGNGLIFFGCVCLINGYLIYQSGYLPKIIGLMMQVAGLCYLTNSFALIIAPALASWLFPAVLMPALIAELSLCFWLMVKGVNLNKWREVTTSTN